MAVVWENRRCHVCGQRTLRRVRRPFEYEKSHDGRPPVTIRIPDLEVIACVNPDCHPEHPSDTILHDDDAARRIDIETYRQLGLLTPEEIRTQREKLGLSQQEMQELLGLGGNSLSRWENGRIYQARSMDKLMRIFFGVSEAREFVQHVPESSNAGGTSDTAKFRYLSKADQASLGPPVECERGRPPNRFYEPREAAAAA